MKGMPGSTADTKTCPRCAATIESDARFCRSCGSEFELRQGYCSTCHEVMTATDNERCPACGGPLTDVTVHRQSGRRDPAAASATKPSSRRTGNKAGRTEVVGPTVARRRVFAALGLPIAGLVAWSAYAPWLRGLTGTTVSGWAVYRTASEQGANGWLINEFFKTGFSPFFTGIAALASAAALGAVALALLLWPRSDRPAEGKVPSWLMALTVIVCLGAMLVPLVDLMSYAVGRSPIPVVWIDWGLGAWVVAVGVCGFFLAMSVVPMRPRTRPIGAPLPTLLRVTLQIVITIILLVGFLAAAALPCGSKPTDAAVSACFADTSAWKVYLAIGITGALLGLVLTWAGPPFLRRRRAGRNNPVVDHRRASQI